MKTEEMKAYALELANRAADEYAHGSPGRREDLVSIVADKIVIAMAKVSTEIFKIEPAPSSDEVKFDQCRADDKTAFNALQRKK